MYETGAPPALHDDVSAPAVEGEVEPHVRAGHHRSGRANARLARCGQERELAAFRRPEDADTPAIDFRPRDEPVDAARHRLHRDRAQLARQRLDAEVCERERRVAVLGEHARLIVVQAAFAAAEHDDRRMALAVRRSEERPDERTARDRDVNEVRCVGRASGGAAEQQDRRRDGARDPRRRRDGGRSRRGCA